MAPWKIPLIVAAIAVPIVGGFVVNGGVGLAVGALVVMALVVIAARQRPLGPIGAGVAEDGRRRVLLVVTLPVESPGAIAEIERAARLGASASADVLVLAPARIGFLDRWTSDVEPARHAAQQSLVATVAALAKAGVEAEARVGDEDVVQAVEDQFQTYPATDVVLVSGPDDGGIEAASEELRSRLEGGFQHLVIGEPED
jgi:hypothetical protein